MHVAPTNTYLHHILIFFQDLYMYKHHADITPKVLKCLKGMKGPTGWTGPDRPSSLTNSEHVDHSKAFINKATLFTFMQILQK